VIGPARTGRMRLPPQPGEAIDRGEGLTFTWNGRAYPAYRGDTIVSALAACGERVFSRSFKYHRPRGLLTASYLDPGCLVQVGDEPNVRGCHRLVEQGMAVRAQNAWPSLRVDAKAVNGPLGRFLTAGFYYKTFIKPQALWPAYERVLRRFAVGGTVPRSPAPDYYDKRHAHPDVLVAGGGPAGMAAAVAAASARNSARAARSASSPQRRWPPSSCSSSTSSTRAPARAAATAAAMPAGPPPATSTSGCA
jgi:sarcosine oxidase, subunit alpha